MDKQPVQDDVPHCPDCGGRNYIDETGICFDCGIQTLPQSTDSVDPWRCWNCYYVLSPKSVSMERCDKCGSYTDPETDKVAREEQLEMRYEQFQTQHAETIGKPFSQGLISVVEKMMIDRFGKLIDPAYLHMFSVFLPSIALYKTYATTIADVRPNLFCIAIGDSGTFKSFPLKWLRKIHKNVGGMIETSKFTPAFFVEKGFDWSQSHKHKPFPVLTIRDEVSTLLKESLSSNGYYGEMPELLCESYDGDVQPSDTKSGYVDRGKKLFSFNTYHCLFGASTPISFLQKADDPYWWKGGLFNRLLWCCLDTTRLHKFSDGEFEAAMAPIPDSFFDTIYKTLAELQKCDETIIFSQDGEARRLWSEWSTGIVNAVREKREKTYLDEYKSKHIQLPIKLAILSAASRASYVKTADKQYSIVIEKEDIEWAISDIEAVWFPQAARAIELWNDMRSLPSTMKDETLNLNKIKNYIKTASKRYKKLPGEMNDKRTGEIMYPFSEDLAGEWVSRSDILRSVKIRAKELEDYEQTLLDRREIERLEAFAMNGQELYRNHKTSLIRLTDREYVTMDEKMDEDLSI